jgi:hypothetical protein
MKKIFTLFIMLFLLFNSFSQNSSWMWANQGGGIGWDHGYSVAIDKENNLVVRGKFVDSANFNGKLIGTTSGESDYLAKYDEDGNVLWAKAIVGKASWEKDRSIATDSNNNIFVVGYFEDTIYFGIHELASKGSYDIFLAKIAPAGQILWAKSFGGQGKDIGYSIAIDDNDGVYITGYFEYDAVFGSKKIDASGGKDVYIAKFDHHGNEQWVAKAGDQNDEHANCIATDEDNNIYVIGQFRGLLHIQGWSLSSTTGEDVFVIKMNQTGSVLDMMHVGGAGDLEGKSIICDNKTIYFTGKYSGTVSFDVGEQLTADGQSDIYVAAFSDHMDFKWIQNLTSNGSNEGNSVYAKKGKVYLAGCFGSELTVEDTTVEAKGLRDMIVACYDENGEFNWLQSAGSETSSFNAAYGNSIVSDNYSQVFVAGEYSGESAFGYYNMIPSGSFDMFLTKIFDESGNTSSVKESNSLSFRMDIFPNPCNSFLNIQSSTKIIELSILDLSGKEIINKKPEGNNFSINIDHLENGMYLVILKSSQGIFSEKVIKKD